MNTANKARCVSVLMSVYNGEKYLRESLTSIYNQAFQDFEFIIIDDCSSDNTPRIIREYKDSRTVIYRNLSNMGSTKSLNIGLGLCKGRYVARMDADDISHPERLGKQVKFLDSHKACLVVGVWARVIDENGKQYDTFKYPQNFSEIKKVLMTLNPIVHGAIMARRGAIIRCGGYNEKFIYAQDYDLWLRLSELGQLQNIPEELYSLRFWPGCASVAHVKTQNEYVAMVRGDAILRRKQHLKQFIKKIFWELHYSYT